MELLNRDMMNKKTEVNDNFQHLKFGVSLQLYNEESEVIFKSSGKWLYPLFEVEDFLHTQSLNPKNIFLHDKIAGRAAASLISRMGFRRCYIETISSHGLDVFKQFEIECQYDLLVDKIQCRTEDLIDSEMSIDSVYRMLRQRAGRLQGIDLEILQLRVEYSGKEVLKGLNLSLSGGDQIVITGDNGTGKSTLLKTLIGVVKPSQGNMILDGQAIGKVKKIPSLIGYVNQSIQTADFPVTAAEVVALGLLGQKLSSRDSSYQIEIAMRRTGCFDLVERNINTLSGGEKQRVSLARCLAQKAGLILMDEPTSFLDRESKEEFLDVLKNVVRSHMPTIILVSHDHDWIERLGWPVRTLKGGELC